MWSKALDAASYPTPVRHGVDGHAEPGQALAQPRLIVFVVQRTRALGGNALPDIV